jgi:hypothetical protein
MPTITHKIHNKSRSKRFTVKLSEIRRRIRRGHVYAENHEEAMALAERKYRYPYRDDGMGGGRGVEVDDVEIDHES